MGRLDEIIATLAGEDVPLSRVARDLENSARALNAADAAAAVRRELDGYPPDTPEAELEQVGRNGGVLGLMKLSALESRLQAARQRAASAANDTPAELSRLAAEGDAKQLEQLLAGRRQFLLSVAESLREREQAPSGQPWVCSIHGILTRGAWQKELAPLLSERGFHPFLFDYKWYDPIRMLFERSRNNKIDEFRDEYDQFKLSHPGVIPSMVAHSMGSYIVTGAIEKYGLEFDRLILCGSIVREDYPWNAMFEAQRVQRVLHDYGRQDIWARLVVWFIEDAGQSGYNGFEQEAGGRVVQRRHPRFRHSDYFYKTNYVDRWIPFFRGEDPPAIPAEVRPRINWKARTVRYGFLAAVVAAIAYFFWK